MPLARGPSPRALSPEYSGEGELASLYLRVTRRLTLSHPLDDVLDVGIDEVEGIGRADDRVGGGGDAAADVHGGVVARAAVGAVLAGSGGEGVVAVAPVKGVVAGAAVERVVAGVAVDGVVAGTAGEGVIAVAPVDGRGELQGAEEAICG